MRKHFLLVLCIATLFAIYACRNNDKSNNESKEGVETKDIETKDMETKDMETKDIETKNGANNIEGIVYYIIDMYDVNNDIQGYPDRTEVAVKVNETKDGKCTYVVYYSNNLGVIVASDGHHGIGDKVVIEYEGEIENINEESGRSIEEGDNWYRINNVVYIKGENENVE